MYYHEKCLDAVCSINMTFTNIKSPRTQSQVEIPPEYHRFKEVFSKAKASGLPAHCPHYAIKLMARATLPHICIYALSTKNTQSMNEYNEKALKQECICPLKSPASAGFSDMEKKGADYDHVLTIKSQ